MFTRLFRKNPLKARARVLYDQLVEAARRPFLYGAQGVDDTVDGRFDMIVLHAILLIRRLRQGGEAGQDAAQLVFDIMFDDFGAALREMGTGDLSVGKRIRAMGEAFYGRAKAYESPLAEGDADALAGAISRNMFNDDREAAAASRRLAGYALASAQLLSRQPPEELIAGARPAFPDALPV
ncbi:ubiquinol-cytochrome C chaperone [Alkalicaulis satelles]|uniref:Ubiquinol-cytochrome C chaperone n=1 Tax=Alkalicaulis satelles TaxID=2609175 RepID=A0A5M6ZM11_9PROT|nr:ubiquinol-cytochrome C chaperone family protein [Alkalicaulis satelles]KAA5804727.1 ubiquinol-cytochrome C chaperone [Alkalicaulis satelles]